MKSSILIPIRALAVAGLIVANVSCSLFTELKEPDYTVEKSNPAFELRSYSPYLVAEVIIEDDFEEAGNKAHGPLFDYISGENRAQQSIEMTVPVNQTPAEGQGERIEMTAPVSQKPAGAGKYAVQFVMPQRYTLETLPEPLDPQVRLKEVPGQLVAVRSYSGTWSRELYRENEAILFAALESAGLKPVGEPTWARYNPPWTLWFMRRNEIMVPVERSR